MNPAFGGSNPSAPASLVALLDAFRARDIDGAVRAFAPDGLFVGVDGRELRGRNDLASGFRRFFESGRRWRFDVGRAHATARGIRCATRFVVETRAGDDRRDGSVEVVFALDGSIAEWREARVIMAQDTLTIDLSTTDDGTTKIYVLHGSLDIATSPSLRAALLEAADHRGHRLLVDLTDLEFLDSTGLGALIGAHKRAIDHEGSIRLIAQEGQILRLLRITGLLDVFHVYSTIDAALADDERLVGL